MSDQGIIFNPFVACDSIGSDFWVCFSFGTQIFQLGFQVNDDEEDEEEDRLMPPPLQLLIPPSILSPNPKLVNLEER